MTFSRAKAAGWTDDLDTITAAQLNTIDVNQSRAIDGTNGGTYTPAATISISDLTISSTNKLKLASRTITRVQTTPMINVSTGAATQEAATVAPSAAWTQAILVPDGATITSVSVYVNPADDALPTTNVSFTLRKMAMATGVASDITSVSPGGTSIVDFNSGAGYQAYHGFGATYSEVVDRDTHRYWVAFVGEVGGDIDDCLWHGTVVAYTATTVDDGY